MSVMMKIGQFILGRYEIEDIMPEGGQACLAHGIDQDTGDPVFVKQLAALPEQPNYSEELARFKRAAQLRIGHPAVVDAIDFGEDDDQWYTVMPLIEGVDLERYVHDKSGKVAADRSTSIIRETAAGLAAIHDHGIVHRDIKPANILIDLEDHPHIVDMGICRKLQESTITKGSGLLGTLPWMAPEQVMYPGTEDSRSDLYSLGTVFYFTLTGSSAVRGNKPADIAMSICQWSPPAPRQVDPSIPIHVDQACMMLLEKHPEKRFQTAKEFCEALDKPGMPLKKSRFCGSCGTQITDAAKYCSNCGAELVSSDSPGTFCLACGTTVGDCDACPRCRQPFSSADHRFLFQAGPLTGRIFRIPEGIYEVGRNELAPRDQHISRRHFSVACLNGSVHVQDTGSANKTYVAGQIAQQPVHLRPGQEFCVADNTAIYTSS